MTRFTAIDLFSGCGGASLGLIEAGFDVLASVEWDHDSAETYRRNIGDHVFERDITTIDPNELPDVDLIHSSPPCQGFSFAGKRDPNDPRNQLWLEVLRIVEAKRPAWLTVENVRGILNSREHDNILAALANLGYRATPYLLNAADYGVPQKRWRVIYIANRVGLPNPPPVQTHADPMPPAKRRNGKKQRNAEPFRQLPFGLKPWVSVREALNVSGLMKGDPYHPQATRSTDQPSTTITIGMRTDHIPQVQMRSTHRGNSQTYGIDEPARTIVAAARSDHGIEDLDDASGTIRAGTHGVGGFSPRHRAGWVSADDLTWSDRSHGVVDLDEPAPAIKAGGAQQPDGNGGKRSGGTAVALIPNVPMDDASLAILGGVGNEHSKHTGGAEPVRHRLRNRYAEHGDGSTYDDAAPTVSADRALEEHYDVDDASTTVQGESRLSKPGHHGPNELRMSFRRLTPWECQILQDFPPDFSFVGTKTSIHRQIGNAWPRGLARAVAIEIKRVHDEYLTRNVHSPTKE